MAMDIRYLWRPLIKYTYEPLIRRSMDILLAEHFCNQEIPRLILTANREFLGPNLTDRESRMVRNSGSHDSLF